MMDMDDYIYTQQQNPINEDESFFKDDQTVFEMLIIKLIKFLLKRPI